MSVIVQQFEHSLALPFFGIGMKTELFQSCGHCRVVQICWHIECSTLTASSLRMWNSPAGIPSPPLALIVVILPKARLTLHSRTSGSRWVITASQWPSSYCFLSPLLHQSLVSDTSWENLSPCHHFLLSTHTPLRSSHCGTCFALPPRLFIFTYLASSGLSCGRGVSCYRARLSSCVTQDLQSQYMGFLVHEPLKPGLENFEHYFASVWNECNCVVVWTFLGIAFLWDWNENWPFPVLWPLLSFPNLLAYWVQHFDSIIF